MILWGGGVNAFSNWPKFEKELRDALTRELAADAVDRVMEKTRTAYNNLQLPNYVHSLEPDFVDHVIGRETWSKDFRATQMKMLALLIDSFVTLEKARKLTEG